VIETSCYVEQGAFTRNAPTVAPGAALTSLLRAVKAYESLAIEAALTGDRAAALHALACNPITADLDKAAPCLEEMLLANRDLLPRFFS